MVNAFTCNCQSGFTGLRCEVNIMKRYDKEARLINGTETTMFVKYSIF